MNDAALRDFHARCCSIVTPILRLIILGLSIDDVNWLVLSHEKASQAARFLYYPTLPPGSDYDLERS